MAEFEKTAENCVFVQSCKSKTEKAGISRVMSTESVEHCQYDSTLIVYNHVQHCTCSVVDVYEAGHFGGCIIC